MSATPTQTELIRRAIESRVAEIHIRMPGIVKSYDAATQTAKIIPATKRVILDEDDNPVEEEHPPLENVKVCWPGAGGFYIHFPLAEGDTGTLDFCTNSFAEWYETGLASAPGDLRTHSISHCTFTADLRDVKHLFSDAPASGEGVIGVGSGLLRVGADTAALVALAGKVATELGRLKSAISGWTPVPNDGGAALKTALTTLFSTWPADTACAKLKAE